MPEKANSYHLFKNKSGYSIRKAVYDINKRCEYYQRKLEKALPRVSKAADRYLHPGEKLCQRTCELSDIMAGDSVHFFLYKKQRGGEESRLDAILQKMDCIMDLYASGYSDISSYWAKENIKYLDQLKSEFDFYCKSGYLGKKLGKRGFSRKIKKDIRKNLKEIDRKYNSLRSTAVLYARNAKGVEKALANDNLLINPLGRLKKYSIKKYSELVLPELFILKNKIKQGLELLKNGLVFDVKTGIVAAEIFLIANYVNFYGDQKPAFVNTAPRVVYSDLKQASTTEKIQPEPIFKLELTEPFDDTKPFDETIIRRQDYADKKGWLVNIHYTNYLNFTEGLSKEMIELNGTGDGNNYMGVPADIGILAVDKHRQGMVFRFQEGSLPNQLWQHLVSNGAYVLPDNSILLAGADIGSAIVDTERVRRESSLARISEINVPLRVDVCTTKLQKKESGRHYLSTKGYTTARVYPADYTLFEGVLGTNHPSWKNADPEFLTHFKDEIRALRTEEIKAGNKPPKYVKPKFDPGQYVKEYAKRNIKV